MKLVPTSVAACAAALLVLPAAAFGQVTGVGENINPIKNVEYPNLHGSATSLNQGTDLEFATIKNKRYAFAGSYDDGLHIIDITDPQNAARVATWDCGMRQGDVQVFQRPDLDNRWFVTFTLDTGYSFMQNSGCKQEYADLGRPLPSGNPYGTFIAEVTNPEKPKAVSWLSVGQGSHNGTMHPSGKYFYNSNSDLITSPLPAIEIYDLTEIENPRKVRELPLKTFPGLGTESHDITFNRDGSRAYTAALSHAEVIDTTRPDNPVSIGTVLDPAINVWHQSDPVRINDPILGTRDFLVVEDEVAGATPTGQCPNGGVHVYDITGPLEYAPVKVGYWNIDEVRTTTSTTLFGCTAHVFDIHEDEAIMTIAFYNGGVRVVDLSGLVGASLGKTGVGMKQLGHYRFSNSNTWAVKAPFVDRAGFYLYGNDLKRGFDVYEYKPTAPAATGTWMTPGQQRLAAANAEAGSGKPALAALCLFGKEGIRSATQQAGLSTALLDAR